MGLINVYEYNTVKTVKLTDTFQVLVKLKDSDYTDILKKDAELEQNKDITLRIKKPDDGYFELFNCTNAKLPMFKYKEEVFKYGNNVITKLIPNYESLEPLELELTEHYIDDITTSDSKILFVSDFVNLCLNKLFDTVHHSYKLADFIPELIIKIFNNNFTKHILTYRFRDLKLNSYKKYDLDYSSNDLASWTLSFSYMSYHIYEPDDEFAQYDDWNFDNYYESPSDENSTEDDPTIPEDSNTPPTDSNDNTDGVNPPSDNNNSPQPTEDTVAPRNQGTQNNSRSPVNTNPNNESAAAYAASQASQADREHAAAGQELTTEPSEAAETANNAGEAQAANAEAARAAQAAETASGGAAAAAAGNDLSVEPNNTAETDENTNNTADTNNLSVDTTSNNSNTSAQEAATTTQPRIETKMKGVIEPPSEGVNSYNNTNNGGIEYGNMYETTTHEEAKKGDQSFTMDDTGVSIHNGTNTNTQNNPTPEINQPNNKSTADSNQEQKDKTNLEPKPVEKPVKPKPVEKPIEKPTESKPAEKPVESNPVETNPAPTFNSELEYKKAKNFIDNVVQQQVDAAAKAEAEKAHNEESEKFINEQKEYYRTKLYDDYNKKGEAGATDYAHRSAMGKNADVYNQRTMDAYNAGEARGRAEKESYYKEKYKDQYDKIAEWERTHPTT